MLVLAWALAAHGAAQSLPVAHDAGAAVPVAPYLLAVLAPPEDPASGGLAAGQAAAARPAHPVPPAAPYPVRTPGLVPARLMGAPRWPDAQWLTQPIILLGSDPASAAWLTQHRDRLLALRAAALVVQAASAADVQRLQQLAPGLAMAPLPSPWLAARLAHLGAAVLPLAMLPDGTLTQDLAAPGEARP
jgi:integrating conjugative element protein (TIGR03765 family)